MRARLDRLALIATGRLPAAAQDALMRLLRGLIWRGDAVVCPCCDGRWTTFLPYWNRDNCICPRCGSHERHRALVLYLRREGPPVAGRLLHLAPEPALYGELRDRPGVEYVSADLETAEAMLHFDITDIPFKAGVFDAIVCGHVLTEVPDDRTAMTEMRRVLKPKGWAIVMAAVQPGLETTDEDLTLTDPEARRARFLEPLNVRVYGADFPDRLRDAGFAVDVVPFVRSLPEADVRRYGLLPGDDVFLCRR